jgi:hypothetical protein
MAKPNTPATQATATLGTVGSAGDAVQNNNQTQSAAAGTESRSSTPVTVDRRLERSSAAATVPIRWVQGLCASRAVGDVMIGSR